MREREIILKEKQRFTKIKNNCYIQITNCSNKKVLMDCIDNIETVERIGLRGVNIIITENDKIEFEVGYNTNNVILRDVLIPISKRYGIPNNIIEELEGMIQLKYKKGFKRNISNTARELHDYGKGYLESHDTYGYLKAKSFSNDVRYVLSNVGERKCKAYENKLKRLERLENKNCA